jgi:vacuolar-type H+-ATPase subunit C/Vma6
MGDYPYINARVKVMKSHLLPQTRVEEFLQVPDLDAFIQALADTPYNMELQEALTRGSPESGRWTRRCPATSIMPRGEF